MIMKLRRIVIYVTIAIIICVSVTVIWFECTLDAWEKTAYFMTMTCSLIVPFNVIAQEKHWENRKPIKYFFDACKAAAGLSVATMVIVLANIGRDKKNSVKFLVSLILKIMALGTSGYLFWISFSVRKKEVTRETPVNDVELNLMQSVPSTST